MLVLLFFFLVVFVLPKFWLNSAMKSNDKELENMPFNAGEFGQLILKENNLEGRKNRRNHSCRPLRFDRKNGKGSNR